MSLRRAYVTFPLAAMLAFAGYYAWAKPTERPSPPRSIHDAYAGRDGKKEAEADLAAGKFVVLTFGLPVRWSPEYREILEERHGIEVRAIAGCMVSESLMKYAASYNQVMEERIAQRFGADVFKIAMRDAEKLFAERHPHRDDRPATVAAPREPSP